MPVSRPIRVVLIDDKPAQLSTLIGSIKEEFPQARILTVVVALDYESPEFNASIFADVDRTVIEVPVELPDRQAIIGFVVQEVLRILNELFEKEARLPDLVSLDLGLPPDKDDPAVGLKVLSALRSKDKGLRLAVHSNLPHAKLAPRVLRRVLSVGASFIVVGDLNATRDFARAIDFMLDDFVIYSTRMANMIPSLIDTCDPLDPLDWRVCELIARDWAPTYAQIGAILSQIPEEVVQHYKFTDKDAADKAAREAAGIPQPMYDATYVGSQVRRIARKLYPRYISENPEEHEDYDPSYHRRNIRSFYKQYGDHWYYEPWVPRKAPGVEP